MMRVLLLFGALASIALAAYPTNTNNLYNALDTCQSDIGSDIDCITNLRDGLQTMSDYIQHVRDLRTRMGQLNTGMDTFNTVLAIARYAPGIGTAVTVMRNTLNAIRPTFNSAYSRVQTVDNAIYPFKARCDTGVEHCDTAISYMETLQTRCTQGRNGVGSARSCVSSMVAGSLRTTLGNNLEQLGGALYPSFNTANTALGNIGDTCDYLRSLTDIALTWPDISFIVDGINDVFGVLEPVLDFFDSLQVALDTELCIENPFELLAEWELLEEIAEGINPGNWGWGRRKRAITSLRSPGFTSAEKRAVISISKEQANAMLSKMNKRASSYCLSAQDILDGVDALLAPLVDLANNLISAVLDVLPSFSLPGFPNFNNLFNINIDFNLPTIDIGFDLDTFLSFTYINWDCAIEVGTVCNAVSGGVSANCAASVNDYTTAYWDDFWSNFNFGGFSWGRRKRGANNMPSLEQIHAYEQYMKKQGSVVPFSRSHIPIPRPPTHYDQDKKFHPTKRIEVGVRSSGGRTDDKNLSETDANRLAEHLTDEQKEYLRQRLAQQHHGQTTASTNGEERRELYAEMLARLQKKLQNQG